MIIIRIGLMVEFCERLVFRKYKVEEKVINLFVEEWLELEN